MFVRDRRALVWLRWLAIALVAVGAIFRCSDLDGLVFWHDEVYAAARTAGYGSSELRAGLFQDRVLTAAEILKYQQLDPARGWGDVWEALRGHPEHTPLYYLLLRLWREGFGNSIAAMRSLSALCSVLAFPALFWLCVELFSAVTGWVAIALLAVSPVHLLYAHEARAYSLWVLLVLVTTALLVRAWRSPSWRAWGLYALALTASLYVTLLSVLVAAAHGVSIVLLERWRWTRSLQGWFAAAAVACSMLLLWVVPADWAAARDYTSWIFVPKPLDELVRLWGLHLSSTFVDLGLDLAHPYTLVVPPLCAIALALAALSVWRRGSRAARWFVLPLLVVPAAALIAPDVLFGGHRSANTRYFFPSLIAAQLVVAYALTSRDRLQHRPWRLGLAGILVAGLISCGLIARADSWWSKASSYHNATLAREIRAAETPLIVSEQSGSTTAGDLTSLAHAVPPDTLFLLVRENSSVTLPAGNETIFAYRTAPQELAAIAAQLPSPLVPVIAPSGTNTDAWRGSTLSSPERPRS